MAFAKLSIFFLLCRLLLHAAYSTSCNKSFSCGNLTLEFPFSKFEDPGCGLVGVSDCDSQHPNILSSTGSVKYNILNMIPPNKLIVRDPVIQNQTDSGRCIFLRNMYLHQYSSFLFTLVSPSLTLFTCFNQSQSELVERIFHIHNYSREDCDLARVYYKTSATDVVSAEESALIGCPRIEVPVKNNVDNPSKLLDLLSSEFAVEWSVSEECTKCHGRGGQCLVSNSWNESQCIENEGAARKKIFLIGGVTLAALTSTAVTMIVLVRRKYRLLKLFGCQKASPGDEEDIELFLKKNGNLAPLRYNYSDIKKMTKSFNENLGKGGYGSVYKGTLPDGRLVAVKILKESQGNGEEFMNEVASISRTSHINIVSLFGFCFQGSKRALIYEFMPNGSLEKFIHTTSSLLEWKKLFEIAVGIARGLEYLHQGCNTRILHFDIKPHNILLDKDFNPRISDFGLAKLCPNRSSIVSMLVARGTIGYIAPEVLCRNFGEVSHKSDVYSYGMMVLEIAAGGKKRVDPRDVDHSSEAYFPHYIYKQLEMDEVDIDCSHDGIVNEDESRYAKRKLTIVGLWCVLTDPRDRPSMTKVVEMLEGKLESLQVPPKPCLSSPPRSALSFSASESV